MKIKKSTLEFVLEASRNTYPDEFLGLLRAEDDVIKEVLVIPGTESDKHSATLKKNMVPLDSGVVGTIHSHPVKSGPSAADLEFFRTGGEVHLIVFPPFNSESVRAYSPAGKEISLRVVEE